MKTHKMKNSGVKWIGMAPVEWDSKPIKYCIEHRQGGAWGEDEINEEQSGKENVICIRVADFDYQHFSVQTEKPYTLRSYDRLTINKLLLQNGDILVEKSGGGEKTPVGRAIIFDKPIKALYANFLERFRLVSNIVPQYFQYTWNSFYKLGHTRLYIKQTTGIQNLDFAKILSNEYILVPSVTEQIAIANFLDAKCAEIDSLTADIKNQIETLQEYKKSVITEAVTKGLDPNVEMKDSGVEWIGPIPSTWKTSKLLYQLTQPITDGPHETPKLFEEGIPFISAEAVSEGFINFEKPRGYISEDYYYLCCKKYTPQLHDIYIVKSGATTGVSAIVEDDRIFQIWSPLAAIRANQSKLIPMFLLYVVKSHYFLRQVENFWSFGTQQNIGMRVLEKLKIAIPPIEEQIGIASFLNSKCSEINGAINEKQEQLEILAQYKQSLIYEYVTGKKAVPT